MTQPEIIPVILAGGEGKRLRPLTSPKRPKPLLKIFPPYSLLQQTVLRTSAFSKPTIVCHKNFGESVFQQLDTVNILPRRIILEPCMRGTAAAIALAAFDLDNIDDDANRLMLVMPSDHYIKDSAVFTKTVQIAAARAGEDGIIMFGIRPTSPQTRYGYIETSETQETGLYPVKTFIEKPKTKTAKNFLKKHVFWNTGIFMCRPSYYLELLKEFELSVYYETHKAYDLSSIHGVFLSAEGVPYQKVPPIPVDYAIMEKCPHARLIELSTDWSDIGCWSALLKAKFATSLK